MIIVKTVLKSGGEYKIEHVHRMCEMFDKYIDCPVKIVCYSDIDIPNVTVRPLINNWPGWWSKIEIFKDFDEQSFYIDLDMTINNNITDIVSYKSDFITLRNMNQRIDGIGSALMSWRGDKYYIYKLFSNNVDKFIKKYGRQNVGTPFLGDQGFLWDHIKNFEFYQDIFPNRIDKFSNREKSDIVVYYGRNRPWNQKFM